MLNKQVKPGFTNYQPHPSTLGPEVKQKQVWKGERSRERKEIKISKLEKFEIFFVFENFEILMVPKVGVVPEVKVTPR